MQVAAEQHPLRAALLLRWLGHITGALVVKAWRRIWL
jgi:hypothetical protein